MIKKSILQSISIGLIFVCVTASAAFAQQTTAFTYQGKLTDTGNPANGNYDLQFKLFDTDTVGTGTPQGATLVRNPVTTSAGVFGVQLDFGASVFSGAARYLEIGVRPAGNTGAYTVLAPRQSVSASPYAIQTLNALQLGGIDADQYVTTATVGSSFIKNAATPQTANFNISGNGIVGGNVGIGVSNPQSKLEVNGSTVLTSGGSGGQVIFAAPNGESGMLIRGTSRADIRFDGSSLKLLAGVSTGAPLATNGIVIGTSGNVGIGFTNPATKLQVLSTTAGVSAVYGESATGRGIWGKSTSSRGVYGESNSLEGVFGLSTSGTGVSGNSTSGIGVYGESAVVNSLTAAGVYGKATGSGGIGVIGESNTNNAVGVFGVTTSPAGVAVYARNNSGGRAIYAEGNVAQDLQANGLVKAMIVVDVGGTILRCYNGTTNSSTGTCGFTVTRPLFGVSRIDFGFPVSNRFVSVSAQYGNGSFNPARNNSGANYRLFGNTSVEVFTFLADDGADTFPIYEFTLILF
jgi:hypothetical protein